MKRILSIVPQAQSISQVKDIRLRRGNFAAQRLFCCAKYDWLREDKWAASSGLDDN
ncbi:MAG: hypothetical protein J4F31_01865 [Flavobacteriales bacterium]|nr:hypothetical protein [Flavobacteriales bacterium]